MKYCLRVYRVVLLGIHLGAIEYGKVKSFLVLEQQDDSENERFQLYKEQHLRSLFADRVDAAHALKSLEDPEEHEPDMYEHNGILFNGTVVKKKRLVEDLPKWKARDDDVYVVSFPKSGTTWTQEITYLALHGGDIERAQRGYNWIRVPFIEGSMLNSQPPPKMKWFTHPLVTWLFVWHVILKVIFRIIILSIRQGRLIAGVTRGSIMDKMASPRIFKSHLPEFMLPPDIYSKKAKIVYVMRNPKDVAVSFFHFHKYAGSLPTYDSWDVFYDDFISGKVVYGKWYDHVLGYWKRRKDDNILFLKYEDMKKDGKAAVEQISEFLGVHYSDDILERIVQHTSFRSMKANQMVNPDKFSPKNRDPSLSFMRKGVVGDWKNYFSDAQNKAIEALCEEKFAGTEITFDFE